MASSGSGTGSPCGACKFLRRKCATDCLFAPYFSSEHGSSRFAAIHKVFGASNASKLLLHVPAANRGEAIVSIAYEAQARINDPVYGCLSHIFALQQQVACLQAQVMQVKAQLAQNLVNSSRNNTENQWQRNNNYGMVPSSFPGNHPAYNCATNPISSQASLQSVDHNNDGFINMQNPQSCMEDFTLQIGTKRRPYKPDLGELQVFGHRMMRD